jgi:tetratricopeptide (TPR) repeat protein
MDSFQDAYRLFVTVNDRQGQGRQLENIGSVYRDQGRYDEALDPYLEALKIFEEIEDHFGLANQYANVAYIHIMKNDPLTALEWYRMALPLYERIDHAERAGFTRQNIAHLEKILSR